MRQITLRECQLEILSIGKIFHEICVKHGIPYYIIGGTQLGAVRHKGFIPWDDDIDFAVPRKYYDNLESILEKELDPVYRVLTHKNVSEPFDFMKIDNTKTLFIDPGYNYLPGGGHAEDRGIYIDIFPLDDCSKDINKILPVTRRQHLLNQIRIALFSNMLRFPFYKRAVGFAIKTVMLTFRQRTYWREWLLNWHFRLLDELHATGNDAMTNFVGLYHEKDTYSKEIWGTPTLYKFEDTEFYGVENYDAYLSHLFGDYMTLPPEDKRHFHGDSYYIL